MIVLVTKSGFGGWIMYDFLRYLELSKNYRKNINGINNWRRHNENSLINA